jgi:heat-inducible transcriptional repressor
MYELTERQKFILTLMVHEHIRTALPVGSQHLVERYHLDMSSATVRNELGALTDMGYLRQPHTSAGRVPSEEGYRYFVGRLLQETELPDATRRTISHQFYQMRHDVDQWMRLTASVLANQSRAASLVTAPHPEQARFKHLELISTRGKQVLMVLVMVGGEVHQRILTSNEPIPQEQLSSIANRLTGLLEGKDIESIRALRGSVAGFELEGLEWVIDEMNEASLAVAGEVYLDGLANVLAQPEFTGSEEARRAVHVLEERSVLQNLVTRSQPTSSPGGVQVLIGGEGTWNELRPFSVVLASYGMPGIISGTLGVLGPMRMSYGRSISTVRFLAALLSDLVAETLGN